MHDPLESSLLFGRILRRIRRDRELSQEALASLCGLAAKHISELERGRKDPRLATILQLADGLGMPPSALLARFEDERPPQHAARV